MLTIAVLVTAAVKLAVIEMVPPAAMLAGETVARSTNVGCGAAVGAGVGVAGGGVGAVVGVGVGDGVAADATVNVAPESSHAYSVPHAGA